MAEARVVMRVFDSAHELAGAAAALFVDTCQRAVETRGRFLVALAGGRTPSAMYRRLAEDHGLRDAVPWPLVHVFWGDERCVAPDHVDNNYRMAHDTLLAHVPIPPNQVYRMPADDPDPGRGAHVYAATLRRVFDLAPGDVPAFDLMILGMGADGHTASLFPGSSVTTPEPLVLAPYIEKLGTHRLTLSTAVLTAARETIVLVTGAEKADTLAAVLQGPYEPERLPIQRLRHTTGQVTWFVEAAAARYGAVEGFRQD